MILLVMNHFREIERNKISLYNTGCAATSTDTKRGTGIHIIFLMRMRRFMRHLIFASISILAWRQGNGENVAGEEVDEWFHTTKIIKN